MLCLANKDQPLRVKLAENGVVHAAAYRDFGGFTRWAPSGSKWVPKQKQLEIACRWRAPRKDLEKFLVSRTKNNITCKSCMKRMGMLEGPISPERYVVRRIDSDEFLKNTNSRCSGWSDNLSDAFFFRTKHTAMAKCKVYRYQVGDKLLTYSEYRKINPHSTVRCERMHDPNLEVKKVKIELEE